MSGGREWSGRVEDIVSGGWRLQSEEGGGYSFGRVEDTVICDTVICDKVIEDGGYSSGRMEDTVWGGWTAVCGV